jgi:hypothetical protein
VALSGGGDELGDLHTQLPAISTKLDALDVRPRPHRRMWRPGWRQARRNPWLAGR